MKSPPISVRMGSAGYWSYFHNCITYYYPHITFVEQESNRLVLNPLHLRQIGQLLCRYTYHSSGTALTSWKRSGSEASTRKRTVPLFRATNTTCIHFSKEPFPQQSEGLRFILPQLGNFLSSYIICLECDTTVCKCFLIHVLRVKSLLWRYERGWHLDYFIILDSIQHGCFSRIVETYRWKAAPRLPITAITASFV